MIFASKRIPARLDENLSQTIEIYTYKYNYETFCHTATLLIHTLKYLAAVTHCFTKGKNEGRV